MAVANYFAGVTTENSDHERYNYEWSRSPRANPVIVGFFSLTNTLPSAGDQTSWCAAFVNFCLYMSSKKATFSALSGSFRNYSQPTDKPKPGDIVVFSKPGEEGRQGFGHVGFFDGFEGDKIRVLGGNQRGNTGSTGAVISWPFPKQSASLVLHSFRSVS